MRFTEEDVDALVKEGDLAEDILKTHCPKAAAKFRSLIRGLNKIMQEVNRTFPDANYYLANDSMHLMLGSSHSLGRGETSQQQRVAETELLRGSGGGDW